MSRMCYTLELAPRAAFPARGTLAPWSFEVRKQTQLWMSLIRDTPRLRCHRSVSKPLPIRASPRDNPLPEPTSRLARTLY